MGLKRVRQQLQKLIDTAERRVTAAPFEDVNGEKGLWGWLSGSPSCRIVGHQMSISGWPKTSRALRIAFLSDLHTGGHRDDVTRLSRILGKVTSLEPDLICLGGDYMNGMLFGRGRVPPDTIAGKLSALSAPLGTFAILGDHDELFGAARIVSALRQAGLTVLVDEGHTVSFEGTAIHIFGVSPDGKLLPSLLQTVLPGEAALVLAHDPAAFFSLPSGPYLMLCGHTHGGQIQLPFVGPLVNMSDAPLRWTYGPISEGGRNLYVTSGIGVSGLPIRIGISPEIALLEVGS